MCSTIFHHEIVYFPHILLLRLVLNDKKVLSVTNIPAYLENTADPMTSVNQTTSFEGALSWFNYLTDKLLEVKNTIKYDTSVKAIIEAYLLQVCRRK